MITGAERPAQGHIPSPFLPSFPVSVSPTTSGRNSSKGKPTGSRLASGEAGEWSGLCSPGSRLPVSQAQGWGGLRAERVCVHTCVRVHAHCSACCDSASAQHPRKRFNHSGAGNVIVSKQMSDDSSEHRVFNNAMQRALESH